MKKTQTVRVKEGMATSSLISAFLTLSVNNSRPA